MQYAKEADNKLQYPSFGEFIGIPNWTENDPALRRRGYLPLVGEAEPREGYAATPSRWHKMEQTTTRTEPRPYVVEDWEDDPETHERRKVGEHTEWRDTEITLDASYWQVDAWEYEPIPVPEPPDTSLRDNAEKAIVGRIMQLVRMYHAEDELSELLPDVSIPALLQLAAEKQVADADLQAVKSDVAILVLDLMAKEGGDWASCWDGLKERFPRWVNEINSTQSL